MSLPVHDDKGKKDLSILVKGSTQRLDDTALTAEKEFAIKFGEQGTKYF